MTKKDFIIQANLIKQIEDLSTRKLQAELMAQSNAQSNPRFNVSIFMAACGVK
jgi:hypothetical protein